MAVLAFTNASIWAGSADLSSRASEVTVDTMAADVDATTFASGGWNARIGGLRTGKVDVKGQWDAGSNLLPDDRSFGDLGSGSIPLTIAPQGATVANVAYLGTFMQPMYKTGAKVGDILSFETGFGQDAPIVRGQIANVTAKTTTGTTTGLNLTAPGASQRVYCNLHVLTITGTSTPTLTAVLQGDTGSGFPSPATLATSAGLTAVGGVQIKSTVGATAYTWYRLSLTITGGTPSFLLYASIGVG